MSPIRLERADGEPMPSGGADHADDGMPPGRLPGSGRLTRAGVLRGAAVAVITATITLAAACSDEDTVDTIPPPWPVRTTVSDGPAGPPKATPTSTVSVVPSPTSTRHTTTSR